MTRNRIIFILLFIMIIGAHRCGPFSSKTQDSEMVFAATEVGTPVGPSVTKDIGPAGGTLSSPDGRLTLTVPKNALTETLPISIQPITNISGGGLGNAYRLEPSGKTSANPLQISVHFDDHDIEGTIPEALSLAYQDQQGAWHLQKSAKLDRDTKTLTVSTTHFRHWAYLTRVKLSPSNAIVRVGKGQVISVVLCEEPRFVDKFMNRPAICSTINRWDDSHWNLKGEGTLSPSGFNRIYTAPGKKPTPNVATVVFSFEMTSWDNDTAQAFSMKGSYETKMADIYC